MILVPLLNPKFAIVSAEKSCELRVRGTSKRSLFRRFCALTSAPSGARTTRQTRTNRGMISIRYGWTLIALAALLGADGVRAQVGTPPAANPVCTRLEAQLATIDRGTADPARAEQIRRAQEASDRQQAEVDRLSAQ